MELPPPHNEDFIDVHRGVSSVVVDDGVGNDSTDGSVDVLGG